MGIEYLFLITSIIMSTSSSLFSKKYVHQSSRCGLSGSLIFIFGSAIISMVSFWLMAGGDVVLNRTILTYAVMCGLVYNAINLINLFAYRNINLVLIAVFGKAGTVTTWLLGITVFGETATVWNVVSIAILIVSFLLPLADFKNAPGKLKPTYIVGIVQLIIGTLNTFLLKAFLVTPGVDTQATSSLLFFACGFMTIPPIVIMLGRYKKDSQKVKKELSLMTLGAILTIVIVNVLGNPSSLLSAMAMKDMSLVNYTVISSALGSAFVFVSSKLIFKEQVGKVTVIALILSTAAAIVNVL